MIGLRAQVDAALAGGGLDSPGFVGIGAGRWSSAFAVSDLATATIGAVCAEAAALIGYSDPIAIDRRLASLWFGLTIQPQGWQLPPVWDDLAGIYSAKDGFIRLHTNAPHHKAAALSALGVQANRLQVEAAIAEGSAGALEAAIVQANGCAARLMSLDEWRDHPQGRAVASEPLIGWSSHGVQDCRTGLGREDRPLEGLKVLDLTRVLAGPVCTRTLAGFGATVLRIDPPGWSEPLVEMEVTPGKQLATLDLKLASGKAQFLRLLSGADILIHGYRKNALDRLGVGDAVRREANPALIDIAHNAYGWTGPWADRRGFDSLVQMSSGIAHRGMEWAGSDNPVPLPVQALDFGTGYLLAAAVIRAVRVRAEAGTILSARLSLARTAALLASVPNNSGGPVIDTVAEADLTGEIEATDWGPARRINFPANLPMRWHGPARRLHSDLAEWP